MAETNKSKMMSEAEIIEAINADTLVSVSLGEGQPQKNVKLSTLASVVAGGIVRKTYQIPSRGMLNTGIKTKCMLISINDSAAYTMGVHLIYSDGTFREIVPNTTITYGVDMEGSVCVIVQGKDIVLKNNIDSAKQVCLYAFMV